MSNLEVNNTTQTYPLTVKRQLLLLQELKRRENLRYPNWVRNNWTSRGMPLDFQRHKYLVKIYDDQTGMGDGIIDYMKSAQVGLTERMITEALWLPDQHRYNSIYFFPTTSTIGDLVQERIDEPINNNPYLAEVSGRAKSMMGKHADKLGLKKMSQGFVYFRGSNSLSAITSVAGDAIFVDELDRMVPENIPYFEKRLEHSDLQYQRWASTPTYSNVGIHARYMKSDQMEYHVQCDHCNHWQTLNFFSNVNMENSSMFCIKCKQTIIPWQLNGEWIPLNKEKGTHRGYQISQLYSPRVNLARLVELSKSAVASDVQQFYNQNLGITYEPKGDKISTDDLVSNMGDFVYPVLSEKYNFMGVDVGARLHYVVRDHSRRIIGLGSVKDFEGERDSLDALMEQYRIHGCVVDGLPETRKVSEFIARHRGRVKMCYYSGLRELKKGDRYWEVNGDKVNTDRTVSLDYMVSDFKNHDIKLPKNIDQEPEFRVHMQAPVRVIKDGANGIKRADWVETGPDHLFHAANYAKIAEKIYNVPIPEVFLVG